MSEDGLGPAGPTLETTTFAYPGELTSFVLARWDEVPSEEDSDLALATEQPLPDDRILRRFFSTCYQASLLREEERLVTFRAILAGPEYFAPGGGPPNGLHSLEFPGSRPFNPRELRRLSVAANFQRSLIGVYLDPERGLRIWGLLHQGTRWLRDVQGGRRAGAVLPPLPTVHVSAPGSIEVHKGAWLVARLEGGRLSGLRSDPFNSEWLPREFSGMMGELAGLHDIARRRAFELSGERWAPLAPGLDRRIAERMLKRVVSVVRDARHGGTVIFVPSERTGEFCDDNPYIDTKYPFSAGPSRYRFRDLILGIFNRLAQSHASRENEPEPPPVTWKEFESTTDPEIASLDEAVFEMAYLISSLAAADGAVIMSKHHELLGFGAEISGSLPAVKTVSRSLDLEGRRVIEDRTEEVGTRHRSAYRLANILDNVLAIVISQDGGVRFVSRTENGVTYWEQE